MADIQAVPRSSARSFGGSVLDGFKKHTPSLPSVNQAQRIPLNLIDEDPDQPRRSFDQTALEGLAASILMVGVLQPVGVVHSDGGRYMLRWGARRFRAATLAGLTDIPAVLVAPGQQGLEAQVMENQQRAPVSDSDLAAAIDTMTARGMTNADIATAVAVSEQSLKEYRALGKVRDVPALAGFIDKPGSHLRALYDIQRAWNKANEADREKINRALADTEDLTVAAARRIISAVQDVQPAPAPADDTPAPVAAQTTAKPTAKPQQDVDEDAARVATVRAWLADPTRPRPPLSV